MRSIQKIDSAGTGDWTCKPVKKWECDDPKARRKLSQKAKVNDTKVVLSLPEFDRILTMRTLGSDTNVPDDLNIVTEGDKRSMVWLYWRENPYLHAASCTRYEDDDDVWEDYVGMMDQLKIWNLIVGRTEL